MSSFQNLEPVQSVIRNVAETEQAEAEDKLLLSIYVTVVKIFGNFDVEFENKINFFLKKMGEYRTQIRPVRCCLALIEVLNSVPLNLTQTRLYVMPLTRHNQDKITYVDKGTAQVFTQTCDCPLDDLYTHLANHAPQKRGKLSDPDTRPDYIIIIMQNETVGLLTSKRADTREWDPVNPSLSGRVTCIAAVFLTERDYDIAKAPCWHWIR